MIFASAAALVVAGFCGLQWSSPATVRDAHAEPAVEAELSLERAAAETPDPLVPSMTLHGVDGAATALAIRDYKTALAVLEGVAAPPKGTVSWFTIGALKGRVLRLIGEPKRALGALGPLWQHKRLSHGFPPEVIALELARAHIDWAGTGELKRGDADEERRRALRVLERAKRFSPNRHEAEIEVLIAQTLLGIEGSTKYAQKTAARKAIKVANNIIAEYPNHPDVGTVKLAVARAYARAGQVPNAAHALRKLAIERAGEPEADLAWRELELLADRDRRVRVRPLSPLERLEQANNARSLRRVEVSRKILDELASDGSLPQYVREQAMRSRAFTAYKQRDYDQCVEDLKAVSTARDYADVRESLLRCWDRSSLEGGREQERPHPGEHRVGCPSPRAARRTVRTRAGAARRI
jgi:tetratricopeptide (TPR) repeat protein